MKPTRDDIEKMPLWELIRLLRSIKLRPSDRQFILDADKAGASSLSMDDVATVRKISRSNFQKICDLNEARDLARVNVGRLERGMEIVRWGKLDGRRKTPEDDGFGI